VSARAALALAALLGASGCAFVAGSYGEACEHLREGPSVSITAAAGLDAAVPAIADDGRRYDVALVDRGGRLGGFVAFTAPEASDHVLLLGVDVPIVVTDASGGDVSFEEGAPSDDCPAARGRHVVPLDEGAYWIELGPTDEASVGLVVAASEAHEEEADEH
jgi:hypothetical protein